MFRIPTRETDNSPKYLYIHKLGQLFNNRPIELVTSHSIPLTRKLFLLKRWRDERITYLYETCRDHDYDSDGLLKKLNFWILFLRNKQPRMRRMRLVRIMNKRYEIDQLGSTLLN